MNRTTRKEFYSLPQLKDRGWTPAEVRQFAPEHDDKYSNPWNGVPFPLWKIKRIQEIESSSEFMVAREKTAARKASAAKAVETRTAALMREIEQLDITVEKLEAADLLALAIDHYNSTDKESPAHPGSKSNFLDRIQVNYIRHELTTYDFCLTKIFARTGKNEAIQKIRSRVYSAIAETYPALSHECDQQEWEKGSLML